MLAFLEILHTLDIINGHEWDAFISRGHNVIAGC